MSIDYGKFHDLESYLFTEVGPGFAETGDITAEDFYLIVVWKANRAKTRVLSKLSRGSGGFREAVRSIAASLRRAASPKSRVEVLMKGWGFRLPMASAILTVLYPDEFSIYDVRVCDQLGEFRQLAGRQFSSRLWDDYQRFLSAVVDATPEGLSLREKDHYLWGRSIYEGVVRDLGRPTSGNQSAPAE